MPKEFEGDLPSGIGSILWSDVGSKFYEKCTVGQSRPGWVVKENQVTELAWKVLPDGDSAVVDDKYRWDWIKSDQLPEVAEKLKKAAKADLESRTAEGTVYRPDPTSPGLLNWIHVRGPWLSSTKPPADEPVGIRTTSAEGVETIVIFCAYNEHIDKRLLITCAENLLPEHLPSLLAKLDTVGNRAKRTEGWIWGVDLDSELVKAWKGLEKRKVTSGARAEMAGHLLGVAWYGDEADQGEFVEWQMWDWC